MDAPRVRAILHDSNWSLHRLELMHDGTVLACFKAVRKNGYVGVKDTHLETARSLQEVWVALDGLKESSILIVLAMFMNCLVPIPYLPLTMLSCEQYSALYLC